VTIDHRRIITARQILSLAPHFAGSRPEKPPNPTKGRVRLDERAEVIPPIHLALNDSEAAPQLTLVVTSTSAQIAM
jgi:hypothetical protein